LRCTGFGSSGRFQKADGGTYDLFQLPKEAPKELNESPESKRGLGLAACFVARNRFAVLDRNGIVREL